MENSLIIKRKKKVERIILLIIIISFALCIGMFSWGFKISEEELPQPRDMHKVIAFDSNKVGVYAKIDVQLLTDYFATYGEGNANDEKYYFIDDEEGYYYIVCLTDKTFKKLESVYNFKFEEGAKIPDAITITGITKKIPSELRKIAINSYSKVFSDNNVNEENFENYYGTIFLKEGEDPRNYDVQYMLGFIAFFTFVILLIYYIVIKIKTKINLKKLKNNEEYDRIEYEMESDNKDEFVKTGAALTQNYIVNVSSGFKAIKYTDIGWVYPFETKQNGITTSRSIIIYTQDRKKHQITISNPISRNGINEFKEIYNKLMEKAPNAMFGYTAENIERFKETK